VVTPRTKYSGRLAVLATKHAKERAVARPLRVGLGLELVVPPDFDTDLLGTFSGEVPRTGTAEAVVRQKARWGMEVTGLPLGLASEGSFGPHPQLGFVPVHHELLIFVDAELELCVLEQTSTTSTNFAHAVVAEASALSDFLIHAAFPSHALIVRPNVGGEATDVVKGVREPGQLERAVQAARRVSMDGLARVETDMRAQFNPSRLRVIRQLALKLARRLRVACPSCLSPGWGFMTVEPGLPCRDCGTPTFVARTEVFACTRCSFQQTVPRRDGLTEADPRYCSFCNP
jgi:hypothetical protein